MSRNEEETLFPSLSSWVIIRMTMDVSIPSFVIVPTDSKLNTPTRLYPGFQTLLPIRSYRMRLPYKETKQTGSSSEPFKTKYQGEKDCLLTVETAAKPPNIESMTEAVGPSAPGQEENVIENLVTMENEAESAKENILGGSFGNPVFRIGGC